MSGFYGLESTIHSSVIGIVGDQVFAGILFLGVFIGCTILMGTRLDGKMAVIPGAIILASVMLPPVVVVLFGFGFGVIGAYTLWKMSRQ